MADPTGSAAQAALDRVPCGYLATDAVGTISEVNQTLLSWLGYRSTDLVGVKAFTDLLTGGGRIYHETHYRPTLELHGEAREIAIELKSADGTRVPVLLTSVLAIVDGETVVRTAIFRATERRRYEQELVAARQRAEDSEAAAKAVARTLQQTLIPRVPPAIGGVDLSMAFRPAGDGALIGGDFIDVFELESGDWIVLIGDVTGKGIDAAVLATLVRRTVRAEAVHTPGMDGVLAAVNRALLDDATDRYCTALVARLSRRGDQVVLSMCAGGHPLPLLQRPGGRPLPVGRPGSIIGAFDAAVFHPVDIELEPGDALVLYTDGVTEARTGTEFFGEQRLAELVARTPAASVPDAIVEAVLAFQDGSSIDDVAVIALGAPAA